MSAAIILFTRALADGNAKSRLRVVLDAKQRDALHLAFLEDLARNMLAALNQLPDARLFLCSTTPQTPTELARVFGSQEYSYIQQQGDSFGERLANAFDEVFAARCESAVVLGSDCIEASGDDIACAVKALESDEAVFGPSGDGGFYLAGVRGSMSMLFDIEGYGTSKALAALEQRARDLGLSYRLLEQREDIDTLFDLQCLFSRTCRKSSGYAPEATLRQLARLAEQHVPVNEAPVSIIVPVLNEVKVLEQLAGQLERLEREAEIIVVDGGSTDGTFEFLAERFHVVSSPKGRGVQLNTGATVARGDILLFLHADSTLAQGALDEMRRTLRRYRAGCFKLAFPHSTVAMRCCQALSNFRAKHRHIMFGDQGIFMERTLFDELGGFASISLMEDYQLSLDLQRLGIPYGVANARILTSDRRFGGGLLHQLVVMRQMAKLRKRYREGEDPAVLAAEYRDVR